MYKVMGYYLDLHIRLTDFYIGTFKTKSKAKMATRIALRKGDFSFVTIDKID